MGIACPLSHVGPLEAIVAGGSRQIVEKQKLEKKRRGKNQKMAEFFFNFHTTRK
jgi:hypothetical protein